LFRLFAPSEEKIKFIGKKLMDEYLYLSDEFRNYDSIYQILFYYINAQNKNVIYEIGDFDGFLGFINIIPGWKATLTFKLWTKALWGADFARQAKNFIGEIMDELYLTRLETSSPDPRIVKMARMVGFKNEGTRRLNFSWQGKLFDDTILAIVKEGNHVLPG
jgi:RimJ/RimL family protein N-acetyltransferase